MVINRESFARYAGRYAGGSPAYAKGVHLYDCISTNQLIQPCVDLLTNFCY